jgi:hypothetical protein
MTRPKDRHCPQAEQRCWALFNEKNTQWHTARSVCKIYYYSDLVVLSTKDEAELVQSPRRGHRHLDWR